MLKTFSAHISGSFDGRVFEERDVEFDYGEGSAIGIVEGLELALEKMNIGETSKYIHLNSLLCLEAIQRTDCRLKVNLVDLRIYAKSLPISIVNDNKEVQLHC